MESSVQRSRCGHCLVSCQLALLQHRYIIQPTLPCSALPRSAVPRESIETEIEKKRPKIAPIRGPS
ncbi:hypothetical protein GEV33_005255 [Tenebrio molitor]|uniref:Uncharacterized protein n=1 Tax=Tenebrio molitor TaxID=7067 RepID=A0A8J6LLZ4_TENMO|nr:hypothetical protein GEV33_005255 [Tenebrio molitor]